jgi:hypothetical protein
VSAVSSEAYEQRKFVIITPILISNSLDSTLRTALPSFSHRTLMVFDCGNFECNGLFSTVWKRA